MKPQTIHDAIPTADLPADVCTASDDPKSTLRDMMMCAGQVGTALSLCWMVHMFA